jgi:integrase
MAQYTVYSAGGRKRKTLYGKTRQEVAAKLANALSDRERGLVFDAGNLTVEKYLDRWLEDVVRDSVKPRTFERYEQIARVNIKPTLGRVKLASLSPTHVRGLYRQLLDAGLSTGTVRNVHAVLNKVLKQTVLDGHLSSNPCKAVKAPRYRKAEITPLSSEETRAFLEAAHDDHLEALYVLAITAGLRKGELLGLKWDDVDLEAGAIQVRRTLSPTKGGFVFGEPKNGKGRSIRLTAPAVEGLKRHRKAQLEQRMQLAGLSEDHDLVFPNRLGKPMHCKTLRARSFKPLLKRAGLPQTVRLHDLRHTCATLLLSGGLHPKIVQELLGHTNISQTMDTYSHVLPNMQEEAVSALEKVLF